VYCGSTIILEPGPAVAPQAAVELAPETLDQLRQMLLDGRPVEAIHLYRQRTGASEAEAAETLAGLIRDLTRRTWLQQPISNLGLALMTVVDTVCLTAVIWGTMNGVWWVFGLGMLAMSLHTLAFLAALRARFVQQFGRSAPAVVRKFTRLGALKLRGQPEAVPVVRLWLEVRPAGGAPFPAERNVVVRPQSLARLAPGVVIEVKHTSAGEVIPVTPMKVWSEV
jgi:hypothetical protein